MSLSLPLSFFVSLSLLICLACVAFSLFLHILKTRIYLGFDNFSPNSHLQLIMRLNGEGNGNLLQCSCLEYPMDTGAWLAAVPGVAKSQTRLNDFTLTFHFPALEKEMATHSSVIASRIPWMEKPGRLQSMGSHGVGHN